jgi:Uma2 family endonuclease
MASQRKTGLTPEEYLALERQCAEKNEYLNGEVFAMGGASPRHVLIVTNVVAEFRSQLKNRPCSVFSTDLRVLVDQTGLYTYPDVIVTCGELAFSDTFKDTLTNPTLIVEVLSKSTKDYDRGEKFEQYRTIASFKEYLLIAQDRCHVEHHVRQPGGTWVLSETGNIEDEIQLQTIDCRLKLFEIYDKVDQLTPL